MNNFTINDFYLSRDLQENILANINSRRTNAIILAGQKGLGKNNFILKLSKYLLCKFESEDVEINKSFNFDNLIKNKSFHLFDNNSHPDFYYLTKNEEKDNKNIPIEKVRELKSFFYKTFSVSKIKVAIIKPYRRFKY
jgi:DNA polymerase III delta prime subunit